MTNATTGRGAPALTRERLGRWIFDAAVLAALISSGFYFLTGSIEPGVRFVLLALIMLATRWGNVPPIFAGVFAALLLLAAWASVHHWYREIVLADEVIHVLTPGSLAAAAYFVLVHLRVLPDAEESRQRLRTWTPALWVTLTGVTAAVLWEFYEWVVEQLAPSGMLVGYTDTVVDLASGLLGSFIAGVLVLHWARSHSSSSPWQPGGGGE